MVWVDESEQKAVQRQARTIAKKVYSTYLPPYLKQPWEKGRGKWYEDWLKEQLDMLVTSEVCDDPCRLQQLECLQKDISLVFGLFATSFRILDHFGMHLRAQTLGQYELWPEDERLLTRLCRKLLEAKRKGEEQEICPAFPVL